MTGTEIGKLEYREHIPDVLELCFKGAGENNLLPARTNSLWE